MSTEPTCGMVREILIDPERGARKSYVCELPADHGGRYGRQQIIEHRQKLVQWHEHVLTRAELDGLASLRSMSERRTGIRGLSPSLVDGNVMLEKLRSLNYASLETGMWLITPFGREVLRLRYDGKKEA